MQNIRIIVKYNMALPFTIPKISAQGNSYKLLYRLRDMLLVQKEISQICMYYQECVRGFTVEPNNICLPRHLRFHFISEITYFLISFQLPAQNLLS